VTLVWALLWILATLSVGLVAVAASRRWGAEVLISLYVALFIASSVLANKLITLFGFTVPGGVVLFSVTFFLTDVLSEFHGAKVARKAVWLGFAAQLVFLPAVWAVIRWPHPEFWGGQEAFEATLGNTWRIIAGSLLAYVVSQNHDVWAFEFWKRKTGGRHLWLRNNASTTVSQTLDSMIFVTVAFAGVAPVWPIIGGQIAAKVIIAVIDTPFMYLARWIGGTHTAVRPPEP
jgi:uncharacterized integral membrane protein (TIGR00697 family)